MVWSRFEDKRAMNRKLREAGFEARGLDEAAICQVSADETDGFISTQTVEMLAVAHRCKQWRKLAARLVEVGRWEVADGGWQIHDYLDYHSSKAELDSERERISKVRAQAGRKGGKASGTARREAKPKQVASGQNEANTEQVAAVPDEANRSPIPSHPVSPPTPPPPLKLAAVAEQDEDEDLLVNRWLETLRPSKRNRHSLLQTRRTVAHLRKYITEQAIDECIGKAAADSDGGIGSVNYLLSICRSVAAENHIDIPDVPTEAESA